MAKSIFHRGPDIRPGSPPQAEESPPGQTKTPFLTPQISKKYGSNKVVPQWAVNSSLQFHYGLW